MWSWFFWVHEWRGLTYEGSGVEGAVAEGGHSHGVVGRSFLGDLLGSVYGGGP